MVICLRNWTGRVAKRPTSAAYWFTLIKAIQHADAACFTGWAFLQFSITPITSLATLALIAFAQGTIVTLRPSIPISRIVLLSSLAFPVCVSVWVGGRAGLGTAGILILDMVFLWIHGTTANREYWQGLRQTRELMLASRQGARIGDAFLANAARHSATVAERNRIAFEWHDTLLAGFSAISWQLDEARRLQSAGCPTAVEAIELARNMLQHYRTEARLVIADLLYDESEPIRFVDLVTARGTQLTEHAGVVFSVVTSGHEVPLPPDLVRQLLRICEEAITNAVRHASASQICLTAEFSDKRLAVTLQDDGCGFIPANVGDRHFGLHIMKQRARRLGAELTVESSPASGTAIFMSIPYSTDFTMTPTRILLIEDQYFSRLALHTVIERHPDMLIVGEADTGQGGLELFQKHAPDVIIVDLKLPDRSGLEVIKAIRKIDPMARIVVLSNFDGSEYLHCATDAGAMAYLTKDASADELSLAIRAVRVGQPFIPSSLLHLLANRVAGNDLTLREQSVLDLLVRGLSNRQIGDHLGIVEKTVRIHMSSIFAKLGAENRTQAVLIALQRGFVDAPLEPKSEAHANES
jgi:DNA-binding NarL/FixJ family response regulator/signal transduction histidine kinase